MINKNFRKLRPEPLIFLTELRKGSVRPLRIQTDTEKMETLLLPLNAFFAKLVSSSKKTKTKLKAQSYMTVGSVTFRHITSRHITFRHITTRHITTLLSKNSPK